MRRGRGLSAFWTGEWYVQAEAERPGCELIVGRGGKPDVLVVVRRRREPSTVVPAGAG